jgi:hypothetical protein
MLNSTDVEALGLLQFINLRIVSAFDCYPRSIIVALFRRLIIVRFIFFRFYDLDVFELKLLL